MRHWGQIFALWVILAAGSACSGQTFSDAMLGGGALPDGTTAFADYDNDGDLDFAISFGAVYRNDGSNFSYWNLNLPGRDASDLMWVDYNNDGYVDVSGNGWGGGYNPATYLFRNNFGTNSFTRIILPAVTNLADGSIDWGDYDNDGDLDMLVTGDPDTYHTVSSGVGLMRNNRGVFTNSGAALLPAARGATVFGDYDNDGDLDILIAGQTGPTVATAITKLFRNNGNGEFTEIATALPGVTRSAVAFGDYDNDGLLDIALAGRDVSSNCITRVYRNVGNGGFVDAAASFLGVDHAAVAWGDYDNDGLLDLLVAGVTNNPSDYFYGDAYAGTMVYHNDGGGSFSPVLEYLQPTGRNRASWGDFDNDGDLDLLLGARIFRNNWNISNIPPTAPTGLSFARTNNGVILSWSPSSDAETTDPRGLNYNLRIGTTPRGSEVMSPHAHPVSGLRRIAARGNAEQRTSWALSLTNGTYYWSVQAIDPGFAGSPFADEGTFTLSHPVIREYINSPLTNRSVAVNGFWEFTPFIVEDTETSSSNLIVTVASSNADVVANTNLSISGSDGSRNLMVRLNQGRSGVTRITITVTDEDGNVGSRSFLLTLERFSGIWSKPPDRVAPFAWGDFDNDGDLDLFHYANILSNRSDASFQFQSIYPSINPATGEASWGDFDNDGDLDLLAVGGPESRIYRNNRTGLLNASNSINLGFGYGFGAWGDYDNDGDLDILLGSRYETVIYRNEGSNAFARIDIGPTLRDDNRASVAWGDYDKDGDLDILVAGNGLVRIYRNNGNGTFTYLDLVTQLGPYYASAAWGDFDNDDDLDFAVFGSQHFYSGSGATTSVYRNNAGRFEIFYSYTLTGVWRGAIAWADYDNDGDLDLLVSGETSSGTPLTRIYQNDNPGFTATSHAFLANLNRGFAAWADFDRDGDLDLALSGFQQPSSQGAFAHVYRNHSNSNPPPAAPFGLASSVGRKSVRLSWNAANDANQSGGLSYNVRVGRSPGAGDVVSPMSAADGTRRIVALGNANQTLFWSYTNLTGGTYYWSVQAIDHSFAGSPFAEEQTFVISNQPPVVTNRVVTTLEDEQTGIGLFGYDPDGDALTFSVQTLPAFGQLLGVPPGLTYQPATNYFGTDLFTYRAHDQTEYSEPAIVWIQIAPVPDVASPSLRIEWLNGNTARLSAYGEPWENGHLEASEDLQNWVTLTNFVGTNVLIQLIDSDTSNFSKRFYRARWSQTQ